MQIYFYQSSGLYTVPNPTITCPGEIEKHNRRPGERCTVLGSALENRRLRLQRIKVSERWFLSGSFYGTSTVG